MTTRNKKISAMALLGLVPVGSILVYVASGVIKAHGVEEWRDGHNRLHNSERSSSEDHFNYLETMMDRQEQSAKEWRLNQADVNRRVLDRLDVILDRLPARGHTDGWFPWDAPDEGTTHE